MAGYPAPTHRTVDAAAVRLAASHERRPVPYGGDRAVARTIARVHQPSLRNPRRCRGCGDMHPCHERRQADMVLGA